MEQLTQLLSVNTTFFTIFNYPMSYIEFFGTLFNLACVYLVVKKNILNWPIGIVGVVLFGILFYQLQLYADLFEQVYYFVTGFMGWYAWTKSRPKDDEDVVVKQNTTKQNIAWLAGIAAFTALGTWAMSNIHIWLPALFPTPASLPLLDVWTTIMSFAAQLLLVKQRIENWVLWIVVDIIAVGLYWYKGVPVVALLYAIFLLLATSGLISWYKTLKGAQDETRTRDREVLPTT